MNFAAGSELIAHSRLGQHSGKTGQIILHQTLYVLIIQPSAGFIGRYYQILRLIYSVEVVEPELFHIALKICIVVQKSVMLPAHFIKRSQWH